MTAFFAVMAAALILIIRVWNGVHSFWPAYLQALLFLEVMNWYDGIVIDRLWVGHSRFWIIPGTEEIPFVARAILKDAPIVVLDEATAFADPENEAMIQKAFATLTKGRTVIMIAHRLSTVVGADKIIVLDNGKVSEEGTHAELVKANGLYARMWKEYNQAVKWRISQADPAESVSAKKEVQ